MKFWSLILHPGGGVILHMMIILINLDVGWQLSVTNVSQNRKRRNLIIIREVHFLITVEKW